MPAARAREMLAAVVDSLGEHPVVAHCCHPDAPVRLLGACGFPALAVDLTILGDRASALDAVGEYLDGGGILLAGLVPGARPAKSSAPLQYWAAPLLDAWNRLGFRREELAARIVPTPRCGLAGADRGWAVRAMQLCRQLAEALPDPPESW